MLEQIQKQRFELQVGEQEATIINVIHNKERQVFEVWQTNDKIRALLMSITYEDVETILKSNIVTTLLTMGGKLVE